MFRFCLRSIPEEREEKLEARRSPAASMAEYERLILGHVDTAAIRATMLDGRSRKVNHPGQDYYLHPLRVARYTADALVPPAPDVIVLALVHNIIEVAAVSTAEVEERFGVYAGEGCAMLTIDRKAQSSDPAYLPAYYARLQDADAGIRLVKVLDKLDNLLTLYLQPLRERRMVYFEEIRRYVTPLATSIDVRLAEYLENLVSDNQWMADRLHGT